MGMYIFLWGWNTEFFRYPKSYLPGSLIRKNNNMIYDLSRVFPKLSEANRQSPIILTSLSDLIVCTHCSEVTDIPVALVLRDLKSMSMKSLS